MSTATQLALTAGALVGLGLALLLWRLVPAQPDLAAALGNLAPEKSLTRSDTAVTSTGMTDRAGLWVMRTLPVANWGRPPTRELAILRTPLHRYYGEKVAFGAIGLLSPPLFAAILSVAGIRLPFVLPVAGSLLLAAALSLLPDYNVRDDATKARAEFTRAIGAYIDLVALERKAFAGPRQAMEAAAAVGDSWVFRRLAEELARSRWSGATPWDSLNQLSEELGLPELADVSNIMRLAGDEGAAVYQTLRARAAGMRSAMMSAELAKANEVGERLNMPVSMLVILFIILVATPPLLRVLFPS